MLGKIDQKTLSAVFRIDYNITTELSLQYYASPCASVGKYSEFKKVTNAQTSDYAERYSGITTKLNGNYYEVPEKLIPIEIE